MAFGILLGPIYGFLTLESIRRSRVTKKVVTINEGGNGLMTTAIAIAATFCTSFFRGKNGTWQEEFFDYIAYCQDQSEVD